MNMSMGLQVPADAWHVLELNLQAILDART